MLHPADLVSGNVALASMCGIQLLIIIIINLIFVSTPKARKTSNRQFNSLVVVNSRTVTEKIVTVFLQARFWTWLLTVFLRLFICDARSHLTGAARTEQKHQSDKLVWWCPAATSPFLLYAAVFLRIPLITVLVAVWWTVRMLQSDRYIRADESGGGSVSDLIHETHPSNSGWFNYIYWFDFYI